MDGLPLSKSLRKLLLGKLSALILTCESQLLLKINQQPSDQEGIHAFTLI